MRVFRRRLDLALQPDDARGARHESAELGAEPVPQLANWAGRLELRRAQVNDDEADLERAAQKVEQ